MDKDHLIGIFFLADL